MKATAKQIKKVNFFSSLTAQQCANIAEMVEIVECSADETLLTEGDFGDKMILVFRGQVEVAKDFTIRAKDGFEVSQKPIIRLETTDPEPVSGPKTEATVPVVRSPAFGLGEFSLVLDKAIRTAHTVTTTPVQYGVLTLKDFKQITDEDPTIAGPVYFEVAKNAVNSLSKASEDIRNLTQAFFFALLRG
tara:strand:- start:293 stop:859 length:567 start_codon:yes stop_codon:yes gene_type:complete